MNTPHITAHYSHSSTLHTHLIALCTYEHTPQTSTHEHASTHEHTSALQSSTHYTHFNILCTVHTLHHTVHTTHNIHTTHQHSTHTPLHFITHLASQCIADVLPTVYTTHNVIHDCQHEARPTTSCTDGRTAARCTPADRAERERKARGGVAASPPLPPQ